MKLHPELLPLFEKLDFNDEEVMALVKILSQGLGRYLDFDEEEYPQLESSLLKEYVTPEEL